MSEKPNVLKFRAENFEAEVTLLDPGPGCLEWIVVAQGHKPRSIRTIGEDVQMLTDRGWKELCSTRRGNGEERVYLTEVVALLYSVPGVEYVDTKPPSASQFVRGIDIDYGQSDPSDEVKRRRHERDWK